MHGDFLPLLVGKEVPWRDKVFYEYYWEYDFPMTPSVFGVRTDRYKYIRYHGLWERNELYDLQEDPHEMYNQSSILSIRILFVNSLVRL